MPRELRASYRSGSGDGERQRGTEPDGSATAAEPISAEIHGSTSDLHIQHMGLTTARSSIGNTKHPI